MSRHARAGVLVIAIASGTIAASQRRVVEVGDPFTPTVGEEAVVRGTRSLSDSSVSLWYESPGAER